MSTRNWLIFFAIPGVIILLALGSWQTYRLFWKIELNNFRYEQANSQPVKLPSVLENKDRWNFRPVYIEGQFQHDKEIYLAARSFQSQVGYQIITPLKTIDGRVLLVNRGWVPDKKKSPSARLEGQISGIIKVTGLVTFGQTDSYIKPNNQPEENMWFWIDLPEISSTLDIPKQNFILDVKSTNPSSDIPIGNQTRIQMRNEHLQYAIVWYLLALTLVIITYVIKRRSRVEAREKEMN